MPVTRPEFRNAMARLGAAVNVVTTDGPAGRAGVTASAVCSVTDDPPTLLICLNRGNRSTGSFLANGVFCVNTLAADQRSLSEVFAGLTDCEPAARFERGEWLTLLTGAPVLKDSVVSFDCRVTEVLEKGTHSVLFAGIEAIRLTPECGPALMYYARGYHPVGSAAA